MSAHTYHNDLPGYDERQILHDGCPECERRGGDPRLALSHMDNEVFRRALARAVEWQSSSYSGRLAISAAEAPLLEVIWSVALHMERAGIADIEGVNA